MLGYTINNYLKISKLIIKNYGLSYGNVFEHELLFN